MKAILHFDNIFDLRIFHSLNEGEDGSWISAKETILYWINLKRINDFFTF